MHRTRKGLTSQQEEYIERITRPKTPADVVLALQNPLSTIYKDAMNMLIAQIQMDIIIEKLIQHYLLHDFQVREQEKEELIKAMILTESRRAMHRDVMQIPEVLQYKKSIENLDLSKAKQQWEKHSAEVSELQKEIAQHENDLLESRETENILRQEWRRVAEEIRTAYVEDLRQQNLLSFVGVDGEAISIDSHRGQRIIDIRSGLTSSPLEVIKAVKSSIEVAKEQNLFLPEEFREPTKDPNMLVEYQSMMDELKAVAETSRNRRGSITTGAVLYDVSKNNREQFKIRTNLPNLPHAPRNFTVKKSAELAYTKSLLKQSEIEDKDKKENEDKAEVILPSKSIAKQRSGFLSEISGLGAEAEGKTGPELLKALREQKLKKAKASETTSEISQSGESNENVQSQNNNVNITVKQRVKAKVEDDRIDTVSNEPGNETIGKLKSINTLQVNLMSESLALLDMQTDINNKLNHAKTNLQFTEKLVLEDARLCNKIISGEVTKDHLDVNLSTRKK